MRETKPWSRDQAIQDALAEHGFPRKERHHTRREKIARSLQPQSLISAWHDVLERLPDQWRDRAAEIFVFAPPENAGSSPAAMARGNISRRIEIPRGFVWLMVAFGNAHGSVLQPLLDWLVQRQDDGPGEGDTLEDLWRWVLERAREFASGTEAPPDVAEAIAWIGDVARDSRAAWEAKQSEGHIETSKQVDVLVNYGLRFALAHEVGHHLLNHLEPGQDVADLGAQVAVEGWAAELDIDQPAELNRRETQEWYADLFALMVLSKARGNDATNDAEFWRLASLAGGAALALLALFVGGESLGESGMVPRTHPRVEQRLSPVIYALTSIGRGLPQPKTHAGDEEIGAEAGFTALLVFGSAVVILELLLRTQRRDRARPSP